MNLLENSPLNDSTKISSVVRGCGPHWAALARGGRRAKIVNKRCVKIQIVSFMCLRAIKTKQFPKT